MSLSRIYIDADLHIGSSVELATPTSHYIKNVLRLKTGQQIVLFNGKQAVDYIASVEIQGKRIYASPVSSSLKHLESPLHTNLIQAIGKSEHVDFIVQKATELGISQVYLFNSERTQTHIKSTRLEKKLAHWQGIIISACEQCGRNILPTLCFKETLQACMDSVVHSNKILLDFDGESIQQLDHKFEAGLPFSMLIGPEGGLTADEIQQAKMANFNACTLGPRVLRMETAAISVVSLVQYHYGDLN